MSADALRLSGVSKSFGGVPAVRGVSLAIAEGERRLLLGPNGAGKTTLFNLVTGDIPADAGGIWLFGRDISKMRPDHRVHLGLARTYQVITLFPRNTLVHNIELALLGLSPLRWSPVTLLSRRPELRERGLAVLDRVGLRAAADRPLSGTSYGEQRRVEIAMALAQEPKVLLLDEPFAGLSIDERRDVHDLIQKIPRDVTIVMIEHNMDVALDFAEQITLLHFGEVIVEGTRAEVVADPRTREVYLGH
jgi:branched-chain amino acid transport system ATP-binding protein